jgi:hypothetical protein
MKILAFACGFLISAAFSVTTDERLTIAVSPLQSFAPTNVTVRVHVTPNADNRGLEVSADSGEYYRSSWVQLDGKEAPKAITVELRSLPAGAYEIRGALIDSTGRTCAFAHKQMTVLPSAGGD